MTNPLGSLPLVAAMLAALSLAACTTSDDGGKTGTAGTSATGAAGTNATGAAGTNATGVAGTNATGAAGTNATGAAGTNATGAAGTNAGTAGTGTAGTGAAGTGAAGAGAAGTGGGGTGPGKTPACVTNDLVGGMNRSTNNYIECDVEDQAIDFDVMASYAANRKPGYDPAMTPVTISDTGKAFSGYAVQMCHPYCYSGNLTVGVDFVPGSDAGLRGEIFFDFPATGKGLPITNAAGRASLGWIFLDSATPLPAGAMVTAQMELRSKDKGLLVSTETKKIAFKTWVEFRYFPIDSTFTKADLTNITSIGFKLTMATAGAAEWHGVIYADHFQLRM